MRKVLAISSWVGAGHVGLSAAAPVLQAEGCEVLQLPTVILSNHYGWPHVAGERVGVAPLRRMADAMRDNGWLTGVDAVLVGYLPQAEHVGFAAELVVRVRAGSPGARFVCDPVLGDDPKGLYVDAEAAASIRDRLAPMADVLTPNRFELSWLTGREVSGLDTAVEAARALSEPAGAQVVVTSPPLADDATGALEVHSARATLYQARRLPGAPSGAGDVFSALLAAGLPTGAALGRLQALIAASPGAPHLALGEAGWRGAAPLAGDEI